MSLAEPSFAQLLQRAADDAVAYVPRVVAAIAILVVGLLLVRLAGRLAVRVLTAAGVDRLADRVGVHDALARAGLERSLARVLGVLLRLVLAVIVVFGALSLSGLAFLREFANEAVLFLPDLLAAVALVLVGLVLGGGARQRVDRLAYQMDLRGPLGPLVQAAVVAVLAIMALAQLGIPTAILTVVAGVGFAAVALTFALAFGLGSREVAREVSAGRYVSGAFAVGQEVSVDGLRGEIVAIESAACLLETDDGRRVRLPHHLLLERVVEVGSAPREGGADEHDLS